MTVWVILVALLFALLGFACVLLVVLTLPGGWIMLGTAVVIDLIDHWWRPPDASPTFSLWVLGAVLVLLSLGELAELLLGVRGASKAGATRAGQWGALVGGLVGAIMLAAPLAIVPVLGPVFGALLGSIVGTFAGAFIAEVGIARQTYRASMRPAWGATVGRVLGTAAKLSVTIAGWMALTVDAFVA